MYDPDGVFAQIMYTDRHMHTLIHMLPSLCPRGLHSFQSIHSLRQVFLVRSKGFFPFGSLCAELTFIPQEVDTVMVGSGQKFSHSCPGVF